MPIFRSMISSRRITVRISSFPGSRDLHRPWAARKEPEPLQKPGLLYVLLLSFWADQRPDVQRLVPDQREVAWKNPLP